MPDTHQNSFALLKEIYYLPLVLVSLASCSGEREKNTPAVMDMYYHDARKIILESGWKPSTEMPPHEKIGSDAHYFRNLGYAEVYDCTGAGMLACLFYFQNEKGEYLKIGTSGEYPDSHHEVQTKVVYAAIRDKLD